MTVSLHQYQSIPGLAKACWVVGADHIDEDVRPEMFHLANADQSLLPLIRLFCSWSIAKEMITIGDKPFGACITKATKVLNSGGVSVNTLAHMKILTHDRIYRERALGFSRFPCTTSTQIRTPFSAD